MKKIDYRHFLCISITIVFVLCSVFIFSYAFGRIVESFRDFGLSVAYYFCKIFGIPNNIEVTVNKLPKIPFFDSPLFNNNPSTVFPFTWGIFKQDFISYWKLIFDWKNLFGYLGFLLNLLRIISLIIFPLILLIFVFRFLISRYVKKSELDYRKISKPLRIYQKIEQKFIYPIIKWLKNFFEFVKCHNKYLLLWGFIWAYNFNFITVFVEFLAYYLYFIISFDVLNLYRQVYKLMLDISVLFKFVPLYVLIILGIVLLYKLSLLQGYAKLRHRERMNQGLLGERDIFNVIYGPPGSGKTALITDFALSYEVKILRDAYEIILERDLQFPNFPWTSFENSLRWAIRKHKIYDIYSCKQFVANKRTRFEKNPSIEKLFGYNYNLYGMTYDNNLSLINLWEALESYAQAYFIYTIQSSYIISNYSIRSDKIMNDLGNFPIWDTDFFSRDSRLIDSYSRHSHILDFDMLRLGRRMLKDNPNRNSLGFGVYVVTEIDKERKNTPELSEVKRSSFDCNQKNDLLNVTLSVFRQICVIDNRFFNYFITDLQRTGSLGAVTLELGEVTYIQDKKEMVPLLPFYSPYWFVEALEKILFGKFSNFYLNYKYARSDNTLFLFFIKNICAKFNSYCNRIRNLYGSQILKLRIERVVDSKSSKDVKWYRQSKKVFSERYKTDCMSTIFEDRSKLNRYSIDDLREYAGLLASKEERLRQNSYFQRDVTLMDSEECKYNENNR